MRLNVESCSHKNPKCANSYHEIPEPIQNISPQNLSLQNLSPQNLSFQNLSATKLIITKLIKLQNLSNYKTYQNKTYQLQNLSNYKTYQTKTLSIKFMNLNFQIMEMFQQFFKNPRILIENSVKAQFSSLFHRDGG